jgi:hypothetical protein
MFSHYDNGNNQQKNKISKYVSEKYLRSLIFNGFSLCTRNTLEKRSGDI